MKRISMADAFYTSDTISKLSDPRTNLYFQSPRYVLQFLLSELERGKIVRLSLRGEENPGGDLMTCSSWVLINLL